MKKILFIIISIFLTNSSIALEKTKQEKVAKYILINMQKDYTSCYAFYRIASESFKKGNAEKSITKGLDKSADTTLKFSYDLGEVLNLKFKFMTENNIKEIKKLGIKHIVIPTPTPDTVKIFKSLHRYGMNIPGNTLYAAELILDNEHLDAVRGSIGYFAPIAKLYRTDVLNTYINDFKVYSDESVDIESGNFIYSALSYDHIMLIANTINLIKKKEKEVNRTNIQEFIRKVNFKGVSGNISFSSDSNDRLDMPLQIMNSHGANIEGEMIFVPIAEINQKTGQLEVYNDKILWPGNTKENP